ACRLGAMAGELDADEVDACAEYGWHVGMAFQIADDILDLMGDPDAAGKPIGNDLREGVYTLPVIRALPHSPRLQRMVRARFRNRGRPEVRAEVVDAGGIAAAMTVMEHHAIKSDEALDRVRGLTPDALNGLRLYMRDYVEWLASVCHHPLAARSDAGASLLQLASAKR